MSLESITNEIIELDNKIKELEILREEELKKKQENWFMTRYLLIIEHNDAGYGEEILTIESNYMNYLNAKNSNTQDIFSLTVEDKSMYSDCNISLTLENAKQLSDYLLKVINYMEDK